MATKAASKEESELDQAHLASPDVDDDGSFNVEHYPVPDGSDIDDPALRAAWHEALKQLDNADDSQSAAPAAAKATGLISRLPRV